MAPRKTATKRKINHASYVQQLFEGFLSRNRQGAARIPKVGAKPIRPPLQRFHVEKHREEEEQNFRFSDSPELKPVFPTETQKGQPHPLYAKLKQSKQNHRAGNGLVQRQVTAAPSAELNLVKNFFKKPGAPEALPFVNREPQEAVYGRFQRQKNTDEFLRKDPSPSAPPGGLMRWLEKSKQVLNQQTVDRRGGKEYYDLPSDFFSGRELMRLPFELDKSDCRSVVDKTLASVGSRFKPPAASTPFDKIQTELMPILTDPDDFSVATAGKVPASGKNYVEFLRKVSSAMENITSQICKVMHCAVNDIPLNRDRDTLRALLQNANSSETLELSLANRSSWKEHSLVSNQVNHDYRKRTHSPSLFSHTLATGYSNKVTDFTLFEVQFGSDRPVHKSPTKFSIDSFSIEPCLKVKKMTDWKLDDPRTFNSIEKLETPETVKSITFGDFSFDFDEPNVDLPFSTKQSCDNSLDLDRLTPPPLEDTFSLVFSTSTYSQDGLFDFPTPSPPLRFPPAASHPLPTATENETFFEQFERSPARSSSGFSPEKREDSFFDFMLT